MGLGFQLMEFGACGVEPSGFFWVGALYINIKNNPGKKMVHVDLQFPGRVISFSIVNFRLGGSNLC